MKQLFLLIFDRIINNNNFTETVLVDQNTGISNLALIVLIRMHHIRSDGHIK